MPQISLLSERMQRHCARSGKAPVPWRRILYRPLWIHSHWALSFQLDVKKPLTGDDHQVCQGSNLRASSPVCKDRSLKHASLKLCELATIFSITIVSVQPTLSVSAEVETRNNGAPSSMGKINECEIQLE